MGAWRGYEYYAERSIQEDAWRRVIEARFPDEPEHEDDLRSRRRRIMDWKDAVMNFVRRELNAEALGEDAGILLREVVPLIAKGVYYVGRGAGGTTTSMARRGLSDMMQRVQQDAVDAAEARQLPEEPVPEERPNWSDPGGTDYMWGRLRELQTDFDIEVPRTSMYYGDARDAFDNVRDSLTRGQARTAEMQMDTIERALAQVAELNREHERRATYARQNR